MEILKRGKSYRICISCGSDSNGKRIRQYVTYSPDPTLTPKQQEQAAYKYGIELENKMKRGGTVKYEALSFDGFADLYFKNHATTLKEYTAKQYRDIYEKRIKPYFGKMRIKNITALDIRQWLTEMERSELTCNTEKLADNSKGVYFRTLKAMLGVAVKWEIIDDNPCRKVTMPKSKENKVKALQSSDLEKLYSKIDTFEDPRAVLLIYLFTLSGIREGEAAGLKWQDIDFDNNILHIEREAMYIPKEGLKITPPKSATSTRDIVIPDVLCEKLKEYKAIQDKDIADRESLYHDEGYIITQFNGAPVHAKTIRNWIKKACAFCDVPYVTVHGLRHTYASILIAKGIDPRTTAAQLGHSTPSLTMNIYANPQNEAKKRAANLLDSYKRDIDNAQ